MSHVCNLVFFVAALNEEKGGINSNNIFYLIQYIKVLSFPHVINIKIMRYFTFFFHTKFLKSSVYLQHIKFD